MLLGAIHRCILHEFVVPGTLVGGVAQAAAAVFEPQGDIGPFVKPVISTDELYVVLGAASYRQPASWLTFGGLFSQVGESQVGARPRGEHRDLCWRLASGCPPERHGAHQSVEGAGKTVAGTHKRATAGSVALAACF